MEIYTKSKNIKFSDIYLSIDTPKVKKISNNIYTLKYNCGDKTYEITISSYLFYDLMNRSIFYTLPFPWEYGKIEIWSPLKFWYNFNPELAHPNLSFIAFPMIQFRNLSEIVSNNITYDSDIEEISPSDSDE